MGDPFFILVGSNALILSLRVISLKAPVRPHARSVSEPAPDDRQWLAGATAG